MPSDIGFRQLLFDVADQMSDNERKSLVFLIGSDIPKDMRDASLVEIFTKLIDRGRISENDCSYLVDLLGKAKLTSLSYEVARFEARNSPVSSLPIISETIQPTQNSQPSDASATIPKSRTQPLTMRQLMDELSESDAIIIPDDGQSSPLNLTPPISEPAEISLLLENTDLKTFEIGAWSDEFFRKINVNIRPYEYQRELVQSAIQARNTIVCLRTGGGKTFIAALLLKYYLIKKLTSSDETEKKFLSFFIVPRRAMLKQQLEKLNQIGNVRVAACDECNDPTQYISTYDVIVCTPQKLLNCLKAKTILLANIDLLCFDDCHDSVIHKQYIGIMQFLLCKQIDHIPPVHVSPIIIGLTSTVGLHRSNSLTATHSLANLCATFNCSTVTAVMNEKNEEELERYVSRTSEDEIIGVEKQKAFDCLRSSIERELRSLVLQLFVDRKINDLQIFPEKDFDENGYEQNLELLKQSEQKNQHYSSVVLINYALIIYRHVRALADLTPELILNDLIDTFRATHQRREHPIEIDILIYDRCQGLFQKKLTEIEESRQVSSNPKLEKLLDLLKKHAEKSNSRALVLVERTFYAKQICHFLQNHSELKNILKPCWLVGQSGTDSRKSSKRDETILTDFKTGVYNVMIATDVVQVGLEIPQCSIVLRYDFVPGSIGSVQARVRARAIDCTYYLITTQDSSNYYKELKNRKHELDLKEVLEKWKCVPREKFLQLVKNNQESLIMEWEKSLTKESAIQAAIRHPAELNGTVLCRTCGYFLGQLAQLRQYGESFFINDDEFYNRIEERLLSEPQVYLTTMVIGKALCGSRKCRAELGQIKTSKENPKRDLIYPLKCKAIKIKQIDKETGKETIILKRQWKEIPFSIPLHNTQATENDEVECFYDACDTFPGDS